MNELTDSRARTLHLAANTLRRMANGATPGNWVHGDHWHIQGAKMCRCTERVGPLLASVDTDINGTVIPAHVHGPKKRPYMAGIYSEPTEQNGGEPHCVVNDTEEYGLMEDGDAALISAMGPNMAYLTALWMESVATDIEYVHSETYTLTSTTIAKALKVADYVLGKGSNMEV